MLLTPTQSAGIQAHASTLHAPTCSLQLHHLSLEDLGRVEERQCDESRAGQNLSVR